MTAVLKNRFNNIPGMEELVFANRNKAYGAYVLRKAYPRNLMIAFWLAVTLFAGGVTTPLLLRSHSGESGLSAITKRSVVLDAITLTSVTKQLNLDEIAKLIPKVSTFKYMVPLVKPDAEVIENYSPDVSMLKDAIPGMVTRKGSDAGIDVTLIDVKEPVSTDIVKDNTTEENTVFSWAEEMPRFSEGEDALLSFLMANIRYPELARRVGVEGKVMVSFTVEKSGSISNMRVLKSIGGGCDEEAMRVVALTAGKWIAGKQNGKAVKVNMSIPIVFRLH
ncbi:MAG: energy transducer TonB [Ignavibacteria bacterium]|jgi:protein TonB|nr:energy transducer TonB [Ignavibacteria bacterium]MCU7500029.1 energy transducer TonB [Ignavibacteria bacterium]MCU7514593.1 energy transducer TonB [Ignavibacteria bacterium]MCU7521986.1 energy transducer TonB [Ignavibacteria bacterium]